MEDREVGAIARTGSASQRVSTRRHHMIPPCGTSPQRRAVLTLTLLSKYVSLEWYSAREGNGIGHWIHTLLVRVSCLIVA